MAMLKFNKGELASLKNQAIVEGNVYITTDEHAMYVDVAAGKRIRIGQIVEKTSAQWESLEQPYDSHTYYYITDINALVRYDDDKKKWVQINGTADIKADIADLKTRMGEAEANITQHGTDIQTNANAIKALQEAGYQENVVEGAKIGTTDVEIDANKKLILGKFAAAAKTTIEKEDLADELKSEITTATTNVGILTTDVTTLKGDVNTEGSVRNLAAAAANAKDGAIAEAKKAGTDAAAAAKVADDKAVAAQNKANDAYTKAETNETNIGELTTRVTALDTATTGRVAVVEDKVGTIEGQITTLQGTTGTHTQDISNINAKIGTTEFTGDSLTGAIKSLQTKTSENETNISGLDGRLTTAESDITALEKDMTQAKTDIIAAKKAGDDAMTYAKETVKPIADEAKATADKNKEDIATVSGNLDKLTTKVGTIETTYQTIEVANAQHKEITDDIAELQAALGTGGEGEESITTRLTTAEADIDALQQGLEAEVTARKATDANLTKLETDIGNLSNVMNFIGVSATDPSTGIVTVGETVIEPVVGDVVIYEAKEYVYANDGWHEYGDASVNGELIEALDTRLTTAEGKITTLEGTVGDSTKGLVKAVADNTTNITNLTTKVNGMYTNDAIDALLTWGSF